MKKSREQSNNNPQPQTDTQSPADTQPPADPQPPVVVATPAPPATVEAAPTTPTTPVTPVTPVVPIPVDTVISTPVATETTPAPPVAVEAAPPTPAEPPVTIQAAAPAEVPAEAAPPATVDATPAETPASTETPAETPTPTTPVTPPAPGAPAAPQKTRAFSFSRAKRIAVIVVVVIVVGEAFFLTYSGLSGTLGNHAAVNPDPVAVISQQITPNNHGQAIPEVGYDPALTIEALAPYIKSVNVYNLKPLSNNYLAKVTGTDAAGNKSTQIVQIDHTAFGRVIAFNADWPAYLKGQDTAIFNDVATDSNAQKLVQAYDGYQIVTHRLALGNIYSDGKNVYVLAQPLYTAMRDGQTATVNDIFLYTLVKQDNTLVISEIEQIKLTTIQGTTE